MRILFVTQWFDPEPSGVAGLALARWLRARGHVVHVLTGFPNYPGGRIYPGYRMRMLLRETIEDVPVLRVPLYPSHDTSAVHRVLNYSSFALSAATIGVASIPQVDVALVYHPPPTIGLPALVLRYLRRVPFVYHIADLWPESVIESGMVKGKVARLVAARAIHAWCNFIYRRASRISVISPGFRRLLVERGVDETKIQVVYNWTREDLFRPTAPDEELRRRLGLAGRFNIVYAGNLGLLQGLETVIRAAALVREDPRIQIVFVGMGQMEGELRALAFRLGLANVLFLGRQPQESMPAIYALSDVLLVHLRDLPFFAATIPSKTQVSLASGRPVLMAVRGDAAAIVTRAGAGYACPPDDPEALARTMLRFARLSADNLVEMGKRAFEHYANNMSLDAGAAHIESLLLAAAG